MSKKSKNINCPTACESPDLQAANENAAVENTSYRQSEGKNGCEGCALFDVSNRMKKCVDDNSGNVGYCWANYFKCKAGMTCDAFEEGGPLTNDSASEELQNRFIEEALSNQPVPVTAQEAEPQMTEQMVQNPQMQQQPMQGPPPEGMLPPQAMIPQQGMQQPMFQEGGDTFSPTPEQWDLMANYWEYLDTSEDGVYNEQDSIYYNPYADNIYDFRKGAPTDEEGDFIEQPFFTQNDEGNFVPKQEMYDKYFKYIEPKLNENNEYINIYDDSGQLIIPQKSEDGSMYLPGYQMEDGIMTEDVYSDIKRDIPQEIIDQVGGKAFYAWLAGEGTQQLVDPTVKVINKVTEKTIKNKVIKEGTKQGVKNLLKLGTKAVGSIAWPIELVDFGYQALKGTPEEYWGWRDVIKPAANWAWDQWGNALDWGNEQLRKDNQFREAQDNLNSNNPEKKKDGLNQLYQGFGGYSIPTRYWQEGGEQLPYVTREYDSLDEYHTAKSQRKGNRLGVSPLAGVGDTNITDVFGPIIDTNRKRKTHTLYNKSDETMFYDKTDPTRLYDETEWDQYKTQKHSDNFVEILNQRHEQMPDKYQKVTGFDPVTKEITYSGDKLEGDLLNQGWQDQVESGDFPEYHGWMQTETGWDKTKMLDEDPTGKYTLGEGDDQRTFKETPYPTEAYGGDIRHFFPEFELGSETLDAYGITRRPPNPSSQMDVRKPISHYQTGGIYDHETNPYTTYDEQGNIIGTDNPYLTEESMETRDYTKDVYDRSENVGGTGWGYGNTGQNLDYVPQSACPCDDGTMSVDCCKKEPVAEDPCPPCNGVVPERVNGDCPPCNQNDDGQPCPCPDGTESIDCCDETDLGDGDDGAPEKGNFDLGATAVGLVDTLRPINRMLAARKEKNRRNDLKRNQLADNQFTVAGNQDSKGDYDVNTGQLKQNKRIRSRQGRYGAELSRFLFGSEYQDGGSYEMQDEIYEHPTWGPQPSGIPRWSRLMQEQWHKQHNPDPYDAPMKEMLFTEPSNDGAHGTWIAAKGTEIDLDEKTINELIAAGADIERL